MSIEELQKLREGIEKPIEPFNEFTKQYSFRYWNELHDLAPTILDQLISLLQWKSKVREEIEGLRVMTVQGTSETVSKIMMEGIVKNSVNQIIDEVLSKFT